VLPVEGSISELCILTGFSLGVLFELPSKEEFEGCEAASWISA